MFRLLLTSSLRVLQKHVTLTVVKVSGLAIGMATFLIAALYFQYERSFDKQHPGWEKIYRYVHRFKSPEHLESFAFTSATTGPALKERYPEVEDYTRILRYNVSLKSLDSDVGFVEKRFAFADENFLQFFSFPLRHGNDPKGLHAPYTVILTPATAEKYFRNEDPVGKTLLLNGLIEVVVKDVFQENFSRSHMQFDFIASFATLKAIKDHAIVSKQIPASLNLENKGFAAFYTYLRLTSPEASITLEEKFPAFIEEFRGKGRSERLKPALQSMASIHLHSNFLYEIEKNSSEAIVMIYLVVGILILLTSIINYINISTAEFFMRAKNVGLKKILGIGKETLLFGHVVETMVVCAVALMSGVITAILAMPLFNSIMQTEITVLSSDVVVPFLLVYIVTVVLSALLPSVQILRQNALIAFQANWKSGRSSISVRNSLVFLQLAASFVMLAIALLIVRQTDYLLKRDTGFHAGKIIAVDASGLSPDERLTLKNKLLQNASVVNVGMCSTPPGESLFTFGLRLPGATEDEDRRITFFHLFVDENFLQTLGVGLHDGRFFAADIPADSINAFIVNTTGAEAIRDSLMTREIEIPNIFTGGRSKKSVVGVIDDFHFASFHTTVQPLILEYNPKYAQHLLVRFASRDMRAAIRNLEHIWKAHAPLLPLNYSFLDNNFAKSYAAEQRTKQIVMFVSWLSLFLAALGIFGTSLFLLQQRTKEIGVRKLLGSATQGLFVLLFRPMFLIFFAASVIGTPLVIWLGEQWLATYPYHADISIGVLATSFATIFIVILITVSCYLLKIIRVQPADVLRNQ